MIFVVTNRGKSSWVLMVVYVDLEYCQRHVLWLEASMLIDQGLPTLIVGDFNCIDGPIKKEMVNHSLRKLESENSKTFYLRFQKFSHQTVERTI